MGWFTAVKSHLIYCQWNMHFLGFLWALWNSRNLLFSKYWRSWIVMISRPWKFLLSLVTQKENSIPTQIRMQDKYYRTMDSTSRWLTVETNCLSLVQGFMSLPNLEDIQMLSQNFASLSPFHMLKGKVMS